MPRRAAMRGQPGHGTGAVGMPATVRRSRFPRLPRPRVSRPVARASAKSRFSTTIAAQPLLLGVVEQGGDRRAHPPIAAGCRQPRGDHLDA